MGCRCQHVRQGITHASHDSGLPSSGMSAVAVDDDLSDVARASHERTLDGVP
jgi:hypothetical protein